MNNSADNQVKLCFQTKAWGEGAGWFAQELALGIARSGGLITFVAPPAVPCAREPKNSNLRRVFTDREAVAGSKFTRALSSLRRVISGYAACAKARFDTNTYLFSIPDPLAFFLPLQLALMATGARHYIVVHDAAPHGWVKKPYAPILHSRALKLSYRLASGLVATTTDCKNELINRFGISPSKISVIAHGVFDIGLPTELPGDRKLLLFGSLRRNKRILEAVRAVQYCISQMHPVRLLIAGAPDRGDAEYWQECLAQIATSPEGIETEIGFVPDERIPDLISQSDAVLLPYRDFSSSSGVAVLMATSQRPLIATSSGGIKDLFAMGMPGIPMAEGASVLDIADAIEQFFARTPDEWRVLASEARAVLIEALSWDNIGIAYIRTIFPGSIPEECSSR